MLSKTDTINCKSLLERLTEEQLTSIHYTLTRRKDGTRLIKDDKIKEIIDYSNTPEELLTRKKILKDDLFRYLLYYGIDASKTDTRPTLVQKVLKLWSQGDAAVQAQLQHPEQEINSVTNTLENLNIASQQQSSQPGAPTASVAALAQLKVDVTQHTSQVYDQSPTVSDVKSEMDESITNYGAGAGATLQVTRPALQNQVQQLAQSVSLFVSTIGNTITMTVEQRNDPVQMSVQSNLTPNIGITNLTSPPTPRPRKTTLRPS